MEKYKRYACVLEFTPSLFYVFYAVKLGILMFPETSSIKELFGRSVWPGRIGIILRWLILRALKKMDNTQTS